MVCLCCEGLLSSFATREKQFINQLQREWVLCLSWLGRDTNNLHSIIAIMFSNHVIVIVIVMKGVIVIVIALEIIMVVVIAIDISTFTI
jgi:hypothetical protein